MDKTDLLRKIRKICANNSHVYSVKEGSARNCVYVNFSDEDSADCLQIELNDYDDYSDKICIELNFASWEVSDLPIHDVFVIKEDQLEEVIVKLTEFRYKHDKEIKHIDKTCWDSENKFSSADYIFAEKLNNIVQIFEIEGI